MTVADAVWTTSMVWGVIATVLVLVLDEVKGRRCDREESQFRNDIASQLAEELPIVIEDEFGLDKETCAVIVNRAQDIARGER